ncbi:hypothetical protein [Lacipirellula parvula]|uniref:hypothetical protein n=1 Tax=Lacipirellula parvula TaxID=2650471 RepID=UPI001261048F|nr:hypothetical protein [Lacipirellula parvula]
MLDAASALIGGSPLEFLVFTLLSTVAVVGGVGLLRLRVWGWRIVAAGLWLMLAATFVGLPYCLWTIFQEVREDPDGFNLFVIIVCIAVVMQLAFAGMTIGVMLRSLYGQRVREAVAANETLRRASSPLG